MASIDVVTTFLPACATLLGAVIVVPNLRFSSPGRALLSIREDETAPA